MTLNTVQFSNRDSLLPGMTESPYKPRFSDVSKTEPHWSGIDRQQMIMGVHDLSHFYTPDPHGFVHEPESGKMTPGRNGPNVRQLPEADRPSGLAAKSFYATHGGKHAGDPEVQAHWASQPLHMVPSDSLIHTAQHWEHETESGSNPLAMEGRKRIDAIGDELSHGGSIRKPAWVMKHNNRLYALDGHHRIVAARESGQPAFPAHVWDRDAE